MSIKTIQEQLAGVGLYTGDIDGIWGDKSDRSLRALIASYGNASPSQVAQDYPELVKQLRRDEGVVLHAYDDHLGYATIGCGRLIDKRRGGGISNAESDMLLANDIANRVAALANRLPWFGYLDKARQGVLVNMAFQMGVDGLLGFRNTLTMVKDGDYVGAARGMLQSKWATQTPERARRLSEQMRTGVWQ